MGTEGVKTAKCLGSDFVWIDSFMPPVEIKSGKTFAHTIKFGVQVKVRIPSGFIWNDFCNNFVDSVKKCNQVAESYGIPLVIEPRVGEVISNTDAMLRLIELVGSKNCPFGYLSEKISFVYSGKIMKLSQSIA